MRSRGTLVCIPMGSQGYPRATGSIRAFPASFLVGNPMRSRSGQSEPIALAAFREVHLRAALKPGQVLFRCPMQTTLETAHRVPEPPRLGSGLDLGELAQWTQSVRSGRSADRRPGSRPDHFGISTPWLCRSLVPKHLGVSCLRLYRSAVLGLCLDRPQRSVEQRFSDRVLQRRRLEPGV